MTKTEFEYLYALKKQGALDSEGLAALGPYRVDNAVIMAAGMSTRFVPLSLETPKGLLKVRGEVLIERQIEQLLAAGIRQIVLVLGYRKEDFYYLKDKYPGIVLIDNPEYNTKNNTHTLYVAKEYIGNTYICSSDDYFTENPFDEYVYRSYYSAIHVTEQTGEWYMTPDKEGNIARVVIGGCEGDIMLGHAYWDRSFSKAMLGLLEADKDVGKYDSKLWETVLVDNLGKLPPMQIKLYPEKDIFEFDSLDELRAFDSSYVDDTRSSIVENIAAQLGCRQGEIAGFSMLNSDPGHVDFAFEALGKRYVYRHPEGRFELI